MKITFNNERSLIREKVQCSVTQSLGKISDSINEMGACGGIGRCEWAVAQAGTHGSIKAIS